MAASNRVSIDHRPLGEGAELVGAREACARLGVKPATLYTYVSRGLIRTVETGGRARLYVSTDVDRLGARSAARRGHAAVAVGALQFGEAVLDSGITSIRDGRLRYRGRDVVDLLHKGTPFEEVAELLWGAAPGEWPACPEPEGTSGPSALFRMLQALPTLALTDPLRLGGTAEVEHARARRLLRSLAASAARGGLGARRTIAEGVARRLGRADGAHLVNAALVACADHELNVSTFAARIAASAGADLYACLGAALYTFTGPKHGTSPDRVEALVAACARDGVATEVRRRISLGEGLPGFGHPLYPHGDPRTPPLLGLAQDLGPPRASATLFELIAFVGAEVGLLPTIDCGVLAVAQALAAPAGTGTLLFGLGRTAGWVAHVLEQRQSPALLRPRARYVGA